MSDTTRVKLEEHIANASTSAEKELAEALLYGYNAGELKVLTDVATGKLLFTLNDASDSEQHA